MAEQIERRRSPRIELPVHEIVRLELRHRVQLLDISQSGALIGIEEAVPVGARAQFRAGLAAQPFSAEVSVKRHHPRPARGKAALGTQFASMDDRSRETLETFLRKGKD